ncbi:MAG: 16S rRNA (cytosine(1402)-N(4))-methyltransferase RsmH [Eubacteriaceae bacterium]
MKLNHTSVLLQECIEGLNIKENGIYVDCTIGGAGHSKEICKKLTQDGTLIGIDQDDYALNRSAEVIDKYPCNKIIVRENFYNILDILDNLNVKKVDGILMDLGVSSFQLDDNDRGFSYKNNARLDMRMDKRQKKSAYEIVNQYSENQLFRIIKDYGEEKFASRISKEIVRNRLEKPIENTLELVEIIKKSIPAKFRREGPHPAKRTFQGIRIEVNNELVILEQAIKNAISLLKFNGRICIITFHSLEDRIVKHTFKNLEKPCECPHDFPKCMCGKVPQIKIITKKPIYPTEEELSINPRSRSAKLRIGKKI